MSATISGIWAVTLGHSSGRRLWSASMSSSKAAAYLSAREAGASPRSRARAMILSSTSVKFRTNFTSSPRARRWRTTTSQTT